jgi:hypothetical protein
MRRNRLEMNPFPTSGGVTLAPAAKIFVRFLVSQFAFLKYEIEC